MFVTNTDRSTTLHDLFPNSVTHILVTAYSLGVGLVCFIKPPVFDERLARPAECRFLPTFLGAP